ncbi:hypothetical protein LIA77_03339 [Sarocladium implicatum]|nr:hypothetical protein LIA77_03339 [Sarocladium implicatum]
MPGLVRVTESSPLTSNSPSHSLNGTVGNSRPTRREMRELGWFQDDPFGLSWPLNLMQVQAGPEGSSRLGCHALISPPSSHLFIHPSFHSSIHGK